MYNKDLKNKRQKDRTTLKDTRLGDNTNLRKNKIYGNCKVYHPDGSLMFVCLHKKANWYLSNVDDNTGKPLAKEIRHINPFLNKLMSLFGIKPRTLKIQLQFSPKDKGNVGDKYLLSKKQNKCVVSGSKKLEKLTKHHITPHCYRTYMPDEFKSANSHDVVPILDEKHYEYEVHADKLKEKIAKEFNAPLNGTSKVDHDMFYAIRAAKAIVSNGDSIPSSKLKGLKESIRTYTGKKKVTQKILSELSSMSYEVAKDSKSHGQIVVEKLLVQGEDAIQEFVEMWRNHFMEYAKPKYMPKYWDIKRPASRDKAKEVL